MQGNSIDSPAASEEPSAAVGSSKSVDQLVQDAELLLRNGRNAEALKAADEALRQDPNYLPARLARISALIRLGELDQADLELRSAKKELPKDPDFLDAMADYFDARERRAMAEAYREDARKERLKAGR